MRKILLVIALVLASFAASFAETAIGFEGFQSWMRRVSVPGYSYGATEKDGNEFTAMFTSGSKILQIRFGESKLFNEKAEGMEAPYTRNGLKLKYINNKLISGIYADVPELKASLFIASSENTSKSEYEKIIDALKISSVKPSAANSVGMPAEIPTDERLEGSVASVEKKEASTEGYRYEYHVKYRKSKDLASSLRKLCSKWKGSIDVCTMKQFTLVCGETDSIDALEAMADGTEVNFIYYKNN